MSANSGALASIIVDVERAVASGDAGRRVETLKRVTDLFLAQAAQLGDPQVDLFDDVLVRLASNLEFRTRLALSERLADLRNAPRRTVFDLANDERPDVAAPVLERSPVLTETELVRIATARGERHLLSLTRRMTLPAGVTDVVVQRGTDAVVRAVAANPGARFSTTGMGRLIARARPDEALQATLEERRDLAPEDVAELLVIARDRVRAVFAREHEPGAMTAIDAVLARVVDAYAESAHREPILANVEALSRTMAERAAAGRLAERDLAGWLNAGVVEDALAALSALSHLPPRLVVRAYAASAYEPALVAMRAASLSWPTVKLLLARKAGQPLPLEFLREVFEAFEQLTPETARRIARLAVLASRRATMH